MLYAYIAVHSETLTLSEMEEALGRSARPGEPGTHGLGGYSIGDLVGRSGKVAEKSRWERPVVMPDEGLEGIDFAPAVAALGVALADAIGDLVAGGACARLVVVQEMHESRRDNADQGFVLEAGAVAWMARAGADLDLDQYVYPLAWWQSLGRDVASTASRLSWAGRRTLRSRSRTTSD